MSEYNAAFLGFYGSTRFHSRSARDLILANVIIVDFQSTNGYEKINTNGNRRGQKHKRKSKTRRERKIESGKIAPRIKWLRLTDSERGENGDFYKQKRQIFFGRINCRPQWASITIQNFICPDDNVSPRAQQSATFSLARFLFLFFFSSILFLYCYKCTLRRLRNFCLPCHLDIYAKLRISSRTPEVRKSLAVVQVGRRKASLISGC